jgi:hypothetical protein
MRRSLATVLLACVLSNAGAAAQILDDTMVPRGRLRLQARPTFTTWDSRYGRAADGTDREESLGEDLTHPRALTLFPSIDRMAELLGNATGTTGYAPDLGSTRGRVSQDVTRIDFGGHLGVFDWLTIGVVVPWMRTRSAIDVAFSPDTVGGADLGVSPTITNSIGVDGYLQALGAASSAAGGNAQSVCAPGPSAECAAAQALANRASALLASVDGAYAASPFFPMAGSTMALSLTGVSASLDADLVAAGLPGVGASLPFATDLVTAEELALLPSIVGAGIEGAPLSTRRSLWQTGDIEVSALIRLLGSPPESSGLSYRFTLGALARLPTGTPEDPDIFLDLGHGDGQTDYEGRIALELAAGRFALASGARYGIQGEATLTKRVALPEVPMPGIETRQLVRWSPAPYVSVDVTPTLRLTEELVVTGHYRYFGKGHDTFALVDPVPGLDAGVLARETGMRLHHVGAGLSYATVDKWSAGVAPRPFELHLRLLRAVAGSGGHTPVSTHIEAGIRLFVRFWGPEPTG